MLTITATHPINQLSRYFVVDEPCEYLADLPPAGHDRIINLFYKILEAPLGVIENAQHN